MLAPEMRDTVIYLLATIYRAVPWHKMRTRHRHADIFNHRVRAAAAAATLPEFCSKLCNFFGVQSLPDAAMDALQALEGHDDDVLNAIMAEHIYYATMASLEARKQRKKEKGS